jgi:hypothetical protein
VQGKTAWPREHLTTAQVDALLTGQGVKRGHGAELLDASNNLVEDLGGDVGVWSVNYSSGEGEAVHGKLTIPLARELDWGTVRIRPYSTLSRVTGYEDVTRTWTEPDQVLAETVNEVVDPQTRTLARWSPARLSLTAVAEALDGVPTSMRATVTTASNGQYILGGGLASGGSMAGNGIPVTGGKTYRVGLSILSETHANTYYIHVYAYDAAGTYITGTVASLGATAIDIGGLARLVADYAVVENASFIRVGLLTNNLPLDATFRFGRVYVEDAAGPTPLEYFDGDTPDTATYDYAWTGTAHASTSLRRTMQRGETVTETTREPVVDEARFYAGVYVLTTPDTQHGRTPIIRTVMGRNLLHLLDRNVPDTYVLDPDPAGLTPNITYLDALRKVVADAGLTIPVRLDGTRQDAVLPKARVWCVGATTWLDIANDLMSEIAYTDLWNNEIGEFRAQPVVPLADRPPEHRFDTADQFTDLVGAAYTETEEKAGAYNLWRFVRADMAYQPVEGDGLFVYPPTNRPTGADARPAPLQVIDAADQAALEAEGLRIVAADQRTERTFAGMVDPFPIAGHRDVVEFVSAGRLFKMQVTSWNLTPYSKGQWVLGGGTGGEVRERAETRTTATVTQATSLRLVVDGASTDSPAKALDGATYGIGDRPTVIVRNPRQPLVQGKEA